MRLLTTQADATQNQPRLTLSIASSLEEVREVQRLRYQVFVESMGLTALKNAEELDRDEYDEVCNHLIVRDTRTLKVVGTYRVIGPDAARRLGRYYSENEFDMSRLDNLRGSIAEAGRACIHPDYRSGAVIMMLWAGLADYMQRENCEYFIGCASVSLADGGHNAAALYYELSEKGLAPPEYRVTPRLAFPYAQRNIPGRPAEVPALIKGYLRSGAWICGEPAWDPDFHCADFFMMLPMAKLDQRYARHYLKEQRAA